MDQQPKKMNSETKIKMEDALKEQFGKEFKQKKFNKVWRDITDDQKIGLVDTVYKIQPLINKKKPNQTETIYLNIYLIKYIELGGDINYFTSGAGAPDNCIIL